MTKRRFMIHKLTSLLEHFPEGLTVPQIRTGLNQTISKPLTHGGVNYWISMALEVGELVQAGVARAEKGRPSQLFTLSKNVTTTH